MRGFSLLEVLIAMAISSILLLGASRFLPALQFGIMQQMRQQALEDDLWQQLFTVAKHLQRAGYCRGDNCIGEPLHLSARWDERWQGVMSQFGWTESIPELARVEFPSASGQDN